MGDSRGAEPASFRYDILRENAFRLLRLEPGRGDKIECSLDQRELGSTHCPNYTAVSYTWGSDVARHPIHMPNGQVINVRENLRNALRRLRHESARWLWIDAICINQQSSDERNHQVKLMSLVYGNANAVLVWLQSSGERENASIARAFNFISAATKDHSNDRSVYHYAKAHSDDTRRSWSAVERLCKLRYWTRKWIIQELISARTVVLQSGNSECPMANFERFCRELERNKDNEMYINLSQSLRDSGLKRIVSSSAASLALQRTETAGDPRSCLLHELVERYAENQCQRPCDHVYALYSLVGNHRRHLSVDYAATPMKRLVSVLGFVRDREGLAEDKVFEFVNLLRDLFQIQQEDVQEDIALAQTLDLTLPISFLGTVVLQDEDEGSLSLRRKIKSLPPIPRITVDPSPGGEWVLSFSQPRSIQEAVGPLDMTYFTIAETGLRGLAACRLQANDMIWHIPKTRLVFALRGRPGQTAVILGRAVLFTPGKLRFWLDGGLDYDFLKQDERRVSMHLAALLEISALAVPVKTRLKVVGKGSRVEMSWGVLGEWNLHRPKVTTVGSVLIFILVLTFLVLETT